MKNKYLKILDITRLIISILLLVLSVVIIALPSVFTSEEDMKEVGEAVLIGVILACLIATPIIITSILGIIRYCISRKKELTSRKFSALGLIFIILLLLASLILPFLLIPCVIYIICDIMEYRQIKKSRKERVVENNKEIKLNYCSTCGTKVDELDIYCGSCGKKLK